MESWIGNGHRHRPRAEGEVVLPADEQDGGGVVGDHLMEKSSDKIMADKGKLVSELRLIAWFSYFTKASGPTERTRSFRQCMLQPHRGHPCSPGKWPTLCLSTATDPTLTPALWAHIALPAQRLRLPAFPGCDGSHWSCPWFVSHIPTY